MHSFTQSVSTSSNSITIDPIWLQDDLTDSSLNKLHNVFQMLSKLIPRWPQDDPRSFKMCSKWFQQSLGLNNISPRWFQIRVWVRTWLEVVGRSKKKERGGATRSPKHPQDEPQWAPWKILGLPKEPKMIPDVLHGRTNNVPMEPI